MSEFERVYADQKETLPLWDLRRTRVLVGIVAAFGIAFLIAGIVMLSIGITRNNSANKKTCEPSYPVIIEPSPYYLTANFIGSYDLQNNFGGAYKDIMSQLQPALNINNTNPIVSILSMSFNITNPTETNPRIIRLVSGKPSVYVLSSAIYNATMTITKDDIVKSLKLNNIDVLNVVSNNNTETQNEYTQICREVNFYADPSIKNITSTNSTSTSISPISTITSIISTTEPKTTTPNCICNTPTTSTCPPPITVTCPTTLSTMPATTCTPCPSCTSVATNTQTTSIPTNASSTVGSSSTPNTNTVTTVTNGGSSLSSITATVGQSTSIPITVTSNTPSTSGSTLSTASQITTASVSEGSSLSSITATTSQSTPIPITVTSNTPGTSGSTLSTASQITTASVSEGSSLSSTTATVGQSTSIPSNVTSTAPSTSGSSLSTANTSQATITTSVPSITSTITTGSSSIASSISGATNTITTTLGQTLSTMTSSTSNTTTTCPPCLTSTTPTSPNPWTKDVLILIDSSNDFDDYGYKQLMEFLAYKMLPLWPVNDTLVNVAIGTFNVEILNVISFFDDNNISNLQNKILKDTYPHMIQYNPSLTSAFRKTARMHSSRHAPWVTLLVTATSNSTDIASAAQFINPESTVIVVGIGNAGNGDFSKFNSTGANLNVFLTTDNYPTDAVATSIAQIISPGYSASVTPPITTTIVPPICEPDVAILIDNSMATLTKENYLWEIDFIANMLVNSWTISPVNIEALAMIYNLQSTSLGNGSITFKYNSTDQLREIIQDFDDDDRLDFPPSINAGISHLQSFLNSRRSGKELVILLFTYSSDISDIDITITELKNIQNFALIIVGVGNVDVNNLGQLPGRVILTNFTFTYGDVGQQINAALCLPPVTLSTSTPTTPTFTGTTTSPNYIPCKSSIVIAMDASLNTGSIDNNFVFDTYEKNLIQNYLVQSNWTNFERVGLVGYANSSISLFNFGTFNGYNDFSQAVTNTQKFNEYGTIANGIFNIFQNYLLYYNNLRFQNTIFFVASNNQQDISNSLYNASLLNSRGSLILVALEPLANSTNLLPLVNNNSDRIIRVNVSGFGGLPFSTYAEMILQQLTCDLGTTTTTTTTTTYASTTLTQQSISTSPMLTPTSALTSITTTNSLTESTTSPSRTTITPVQVPQCYSYIPLGIDVSNDIDNNVYVNEIQFIISGVSQLYNPSIYSMYYAYGFGDGQVDPTVYFINAPVSGLIYMVTQVLKHTTYSPNFLDLLSLMSNPNALTGYSNTTTINTILMMGSTPNSTILSSTASMITTLINFGYGNNTVIAIALNSNVTSNDIKPWTDVGMKFLAWNEDITNLTLTLRGMMNCQEQITSSLSTQPISSTNSITPSITTSPILSFTCNAYISIAIDNSNDTQTSDYESQRNYLQDFQNGLVSLLSQNLNYTIYTYGEQFLEEQTLQYSQLQSFFINFNITASKTNFTPTFERLVQHMAADANNINTYSAQYPLNSIIFFGSKPSDLIQNQMVDSIKQISSGNRTIIGILLSNQINETDLKNLTDNGLQVIPWNAEPNNLTSAIISKLKC